MNINYAERDRERDRGEVYRSGSTAIRMPGYPDAWRDRVPRADGQPGERDHTHFGPEWVRKERVRQLKVEADLLYQFAVLVASKTNHRVDTYWRGGAGGQAMLDMMIANVVTDLSPMTTSSPLSAEEAAAARKEMLEKTFSLVDNYDTQERMQRFATSLGPSRQELLSRPEQQQEWERLVREADEGRLQRRSITAPGSRVTVPLAPPPGTNVPTTPAGVATPPPPGPQPSGLASTPSAGQTPQRARPVLTPLSRITPAPTPAEQQTMEEEQQRQTRSKELKGARGPDGNIVYGVTDKWIMLLRLLLRGATETDLKAWSMLYNTPGDDLKRRLQEGDTSAYEQYLNDLSKVRALLRRGEGGNDWVRAPQHTGWIFFTEQFAGAVAGAASEVHNLCGQHWVVELDLMTHDGVRDYFASLVANKMLKSKSAAYGRYGGTTNMQQSHSREHAGLIQVFKRLTKKSDGMLGIQGQISTTGDAMRAATSQSRRDFMNEQGRYYSDLYRY